MRVCFAAAKQTLQSTALSGIAAAPQLHRSSQQHMLFITLLSAAIFSSSSCEAARILALLAYNSRSHFIVMEPLLLELHKRGHDLTVVSSFPQEQPLRNFTDIDFSAPLPSSVNRYSLSSIKETMPNIFQTPIHITEIHLHTCEIVLGDNRVLQLLNEKFDLVIGEIFGSDCFNYIPYKLKVPFVSWITTAAQPWMAARTGLPDNPSYIPNLYTDYSEHMSLFQRLFNTVVLLYTKSVYFLYSELHSQTVAERVFGEPLPTMEEVNGLTSMVFVNSHFTLAQSRPFTPNVVEIGGIHIRETQHLPKDLKELLDTAEEGVIVMSFGSLVKTSTLPPHMIRMFLEVFASLPQKVIFKYEEDLPDVPANVFVRPWLPQTDIIAHQNVKLLITHCGLASTIEAVHFAKPLVAVPFYSDQFRNAKNVVQRGAGVVVNSDNLSKQDFSQAVKSVLGDPSYAENMRRLSQQFRDRPLTPLQSAVYWTEYVIRHQGASHLRPASVSLPLYQYLLLDVIAGITSAILAVLLICYCLTRFICSRLVVRICGKPVVTNKRVEKSKKLS